MVYNTVWMPYWKFLFFDMHFWTEHNTLSFVLNPKSCQDMYGCSPINCQPVNSYYMNVLAEIFVLCYGKNIKYII